MQPDRRRRLGRRVVAAGGLSAALLFAQPARAWTITTDICNDGSTDLYVAMLERFYTILAGGEYFIREGWKVVAPGACKQFKPNGSVGSRSAFSFAIKSSSGALINPIYKSDDMKDPRVELSTLCMPSDVTQWAWRRERGDVSPLTVDCEPGWVSLRASFMLTGRDEHDYYKLTATPQRVDDGPPPAPRAAVVPPPAAPIGDPAPTTPYAAPLPATEGEAQPPAATATQPDAGPMTEPVQATVTVEQASPGNPALALVLGALGGGALVAMIFWLIHRRTRARAD